MRGCCNICYRDRAICGPLVEGYQKKPVCKSCAPLSRAPSCRACGEIVRGGKPGTEVYHKECRRCSSCKQVVRANQVRYAAGRLLCGTCGPLFEKFFVPAGSDNDIERVKEAWAHWQKDSAGHVSAENLLKVLITLNPDFIERDVIRLMRVIDRNDSGTIDFSEFFAWITEEDPLSMMGVFDEHIGKLMRDAGLAEARSGTTRVSEIQLRPDGLVFVNRNGDNRVECRCIATEDGEVELVCLDTEEFIYKVECTGRHLAITTNTGRAFRLPCRADPFGPWLAPAGFAISGFRTKSLEALAATEAGHPVPRNSRIPSGVRSGQRVEHVIEDRVVGIRIAPLSCAESYDPASALQYAAERGYQITLREILSKGVVDVNCSSIGGTTALMLAADQGDVMSVQMLVCGKASVNIADTDGWTALTYAIAFGYSHAEDILLKKGGAVRMDSKGRAAYSNAGRDGNGCEARAILRSWCEPPKRGVFAVEAGSLAAKNEPEVPTISPPGGIFTGGVEVRLRCGVNEDKKTTILYTLDGRDPKLTGTRYRAPLTLVGSRLHLRAVAVRGSARSRSAEAIFVGCDFVVPDCVVSGALQVCTIFEAKPLVHKSLATALDMPAALVSLGDVDQGVSGDKCWLRVPVHNPKPKRRLCLDQKFTTIGRSEKMRKGFLEKVLRDLQHKKACNVKAENVALSEFRKQIALTFLLPREPAEELARQLADPSSFLRSEARRRNPLWASASVEAVDPLGERVCDTTLGKSLQASLKKSAPLEGVVGFGADESGVIGFLAPSGKDLKKLKRALPRVIKEFLPDAVLGEALECPRYINFEYSVDVISRPGWGAAQVAESAASSTFAQQVSKALAGPGDALNAAQVTVLRPARMKQLHRLQLRLAWRGREAGPAEVGPIYPHLDVICMVYNGSHLDEMKVFGPVVQPKLLSVEDLRGKTDRALSGSIFEPVIHTGCHVDGRNGVQEVDLELPKLVGYATDLHFVLATHGAGDDLQFFPQLTLSLVDPEPDGPGRELLGHTFTLIANSEAKAMVMCSVSYTDTGKWIAVKRGRSLEGRDGHTLQEAVAEHQELHDRWMRRQHLVKLRVLCKLQWLVRSSSGDFAQLLWNVLALPVPVFQLLCSWF